MELRSENPTNLRQRPTSTVEQCERRIKGSLVLSVAKLADELTARKFFNSPVAEAQPVPTACVAEKTSSNFLAGEWSAADVAGDIGIGPKRYARRKIFAAMRAQPEPRRRDTRNWRGRVRQGRRQAG